LTCTEFVPFILKESRLGEAEEEYRRETGKPRFIGKTAVKPG